MAVRQLFPDRYQTVNSSREYVAVCTIHTVKRCSATQEKETKSFHISVSWHSMAASRKLRKVQVVLRGQVDCQLCTGIANTAVGAPNKCW